MNKPFFSIVTPTYKSNLFHLFQLFISIKRQKFRNWEWVITDDGSGSKSLSRLLRLFRTLDSRIQINFSESNQGIVRATNNSIKSSLGEFLVFVDHDDLISRDALAEAAQAIKDHPTAIYLYSDEDKLGKWGKYYDSFLKPDWSPERLRGQMYLGHLSIIKKKQVLEVGCLHSEFEGSQDHDLALRVTELEGDVIHIPKILYHWRAGKNSTALSPGAKPYTWVAGLSAVQAQLNRLNIQAVADFGPVPGTYLVERKYKKTESISVVIPTRGTEGVVEGERRLFLEQCIDSILESSPEANLEIIVVYDTDTPVNILNRIQEKWIGRLKLVQFSGQFNFSRKCNLGFLQSTSDWIVFLNDDIEIISQDFMHKLCAPLIDEFVGAVGAKLLYEDKSIQHAGLSVHEGEMWNISAGEPENAYGYFSSLLINREVTGVTGAALAISRRNFELVGGFSEALPGNFNDVDLCLKLNSQGLHNLWLSGVQAFHFESKSRVPTVHGYEHDLILSRWGRSVADPYLADSSNSKSAS